MNVELIVHSLFPPREGAAGAGRAQWEFDSFAALAIEEHELRQMTTLAGLLDARESRKLEDRFLHAFLRACDTLAMVRLWNEFARREKHIRTGKTCWGSERASAKRAEHRLARPCRKSR